MRKICLFILWSVVFSLTPSCDYISNRLLKDDGILVTGKVGEILVVCEQDIWDSKIKKLLDSNLTQFIMPYYPDVATFELLHKTPDHFEKGSKRYRNTLFLNLNPKLKKAKFEIKEDVWANGQLVVELSAKNKSELLTLCHNKLKEVHGYFDEVEWVRLIEKHQKTTNQVLQNEISSKFNISLALPESSKIVSRADDFIRIEFPSASRPIVFVGNGTQDPGAINSGILIYQYDYNSLEQLELKNLLERRDTILKYNVPHESEGYFMGTQYHKLVYPETNSALNYSENLDGVEMRGMFQFKHNYKKNGTGGAFWAFHFVHPKTKKLICISGYVDAPSTTSWTHALREVQAVWKSTKVL